MVQCIFTIFYIMSSKICFLLFQPNGIDPSKKGSAKAENEDNHFFAKVRLILKKIKFALVSFKIQCNI